MAVRLLQMTAAAGHFLQEGRLYKAFRLLEQVRAALPAASMAADKAAALCAPPPYPTLFYPTLPYPTLPLDIASS